MRTLIVCVLILLACSVSGARAAAGWTYGVYVDAGYLNSDNEPGNRTWRSKSTTFKLDRVEANNVTGYVRKDATSSSRWGFEIGLQTGVDIDGLVTSSPPPHYESIDNADNWAKLGVTSVKYLFPVGNGLGLTGGLLSGFIAYESYRALPNPNYTRGYLTDYVPYFSWGAKVDYPFHEEFSAEFWVMTGYNYLAIPNDSPALGLQLTWQPVNSLTFTQNLYYGPEQPETSIDYWRFLSDTIVEWRYGMYLLAAAIDFGHARQAWLADTPYRKWSSGAVWAGIDITRSWRFAVRPEFYWDPDGLMTGARQTIRALTTTVEYHASFLEHNDLSARIEYRYDRSTGDDGGFYAGEDNHLVPEQNLFIVALIWSFEWKTGTE